MSRAPGIDPGRLSRALAWAEADYRHCMVCARRCGVDRHAGELGVCGLGPGARVYKEYLHLGEERCLVPSHTIFLTGCSLRCAFCSDMGPVEAPQAHGTPLSPEALARRIALRRSQGARNVSFVGGTPDTSVLFILQTLALCPPDTHVVWNSNLWSTDVAIEHLSGIVSTWLLDHKFGDDECARSLAGVRDYVGTIERLLLQVQGTGELIVRHLLMPGHLDCCTVPVLRFVERQLPGATVNLMTGYHPFRLAGRPGPMSGRVPPAERDRALALLASLDVAGRLADGVEYPPGP